MLRAYARVGDHLASEVYWVHHIPCLVIPGRFCVTPVDTVSRVFDMFFFTHLRQVMIYRTVDTIVSHLPLCATDCTDSTAPTRQHELEDHTDHTDRTDHLP